MPTPGATSATIDDKVNGSFYDHYDGTYAQRVVTDQVVNGYSSTSNANTVTAPAANATIATLTSASGGFYQIDVTYGYGGTAEATTADNFVLSVGGNVVGNLTAPVAGANTLQPKQTFYAQVPSSGVVKVTAGGTAGSAGSVYKAMLIITRLG